MALGARAPRASVSRGVVEVLERSGPSQQLEVRLWLKSASENRCFVGIAILSCLTFYRHKAKFYDLSNDVWVRESASESDSGFEMDTAVNEDTVVEVLADANGN